MSNTLNHSLRQYLITIIYIYHAQLKQYKTYNYHVYVLCVLRVSNSKILLDKIKSWIPIILMICILFFSLANRNNLDISFAFHLYPRVLSLYDYVMILWSYRKRKSLQLLQYTKEYAKSHRLTRERNFFPWTKFFSSYLFFVALRKLYIILIIFRIPFHNLCNSL